VVRNSADTTEQFPQPPADPSVASPQLRHVYVWMMVVAGICGWSVPGFYDWTGSDQSRPSPWIWRVALAFLVGLVAFHGTLLWLQFSKRWQTVASANRSPLTISQIMIATLITAVLIAVVKQISASVGHVVAITVYFAVLGYTIYLARHTPSLRLPIATLLVCQYAPFVWLAGSKIFMTESTALLGLASLPALLPAALIANVLQQKMQGAFWIGLLLTSLELTVCLWLARQGEKRTVAYIAVVLVLALFGSFALNAMVRA
jgi:hypothetical protein